VLTGQQHADVGGGDASREGHQLAHLAADHGLATFGRDVFDRPQGEPLFALGAGALEVVDGGEEQHDGVERGHRFDVGLRVDEELDVAVARDANGNALRCIGGRGGRQRFTARGEQFRRVVGFLANGSRPSDTRSLF